MKAKLSLQEELGALKSELSSFGPAPDPPLASAEIQKKINDERDASIGDKRTNKDGDAALKNSSTTASAAAVYEVQERDDADDLDDDEDVDQDDDLDEDEDEMMDNGGRLTAQDLVNSYVQPNNTTSNEEEAKAE